VDGFLERDAGEASLHGHELHLHDTTFRDSKPIEVVVPPDRDPGAGRLLRARAHVYARRWASWRPGHPLHARPLDAERSPPRRVLLLVGAWSRRRPPRQPWHGRSVCHVRGSIGGWIDAS
jgi:hypothetical protein